MNIIANLKDEISEIIVKAFDGVIKDGVFERGDIDVRKDIKLEIPKDKRHGDFACNIAILLAKPLKCAPRKIAEEIVSRMEKSDNVEKVDIAGAGFINFYLTRNWLYKALGAVEEMGENYGKTDYGKGKRVVVEFVSANPTGPMHMGNARGGALGDCMAGVLEYAGYDVTREFYVNDAGNQIEKFGNSLEARYIQELKGEDAIRFPEDGYKGEDIRVHAKNFIELYGDRYLDCDGETRKSALVGYALEKNVDALKSDLEKYRIVYDVWFREKKLHESGAVQKAIERLKENGYTYEKEGATWLNCIKMGFEKDEVLIRQNGIPTYFAADIAYHIDKLETRGFDVAINVWGADHHGHVARMKSAMEAVGIDGDRLEIVIMQLVRLMQDGEIVRMSKRTGKAITLSDLLKETSIDVARFFFNMRTAGSHLDFDLDLAMEQSANNPVYYVQYAHARICSIIKKLEEEGVKVKKYCEIKSDKLVEESELDLLKKICELPEEIKAAAIAREPAKITRYVIDLATLFHSFYNSCRVKCGDGELMAARLKLVDSVRIVIASALKMLKITAPEHM